MKKLVKISLVLVAMIAFGATSYAQHSASASSKAIVIAPIAIQKNLDLDFGNIIADGTGGTVSVAADAVGTRTASPLTLISSAQAGTVQSAKFTITGQDGFTYTITLPQTDVTLVGPAGSNDMTIDHTTFLSSIASPATFSGSSAVLYVGATLAVGADQDAGTYNSTSDFTITVDYQ